MAPSHANPSLFSLFDQVLRGNLLQRDALQQGRTPVQRLVVLGLLLGGLYGIALGCYALFGGADRAWLQTFATFCKVPLLFLLTLLVTFPSLYVFAALQRLPLDCGATLRLLLLAILVDLAVIASLGPVFAFFAASTRSYAFMLLLHVAFCALGGVLGFMVLRRATGELYAVPPPADGEDGGAAAAARSALQAKEQTRRLLRTWCLVYGAVGAQMGWLLRPFLGAPDLAFAWFRPREDNFFIGVVNALRLLFGK